MKVYKTCPICSKPFNPCRVNISTTGTFNWRSVVCSFECGKKYLEKTESKVSPQNGESTSQAFADIVMNDIRNLKTVEVDDNNNIVTKSSKGKLKDDPVKKSTKGSKN